MVMVEKMGFEPGLTSPCLFTHAGRDVRTGVHGDDFIIVSDEEGCDWTENGMRGHWELKRKGGKKAKKSKRGGDSADLIKIVEMIMSRNYSPVIVFSFSKRQCENYAAAVVRKGLDFNTSEEKQQISMVFNAAVDNLAEEDRELPQIQEILPLLKRGVGIHHGGLIPLIKEVVEIFVEMGGSRNSLEVYVTDFEDMLLSTT